MRPMLGAYSHIYDICGCNLTEIAQSKGVYTKSITNNGQK